MKPDLNVGESRAASFRPTGLVDVNYRWLNMKRSTNYYIHQGDWFPNRDCGFRIRHVGRRLGNFPPKSPIAAIYQAHSYGAKPLENSGVCSIMKLS